MLKIGSKVELLSKGQKGIIYDATENMDKIWVETEEDIFITTLEDVRPIVKAPKVRTTIDFSKFESKDTVFDTVDYRTLTACIKVECDNIEYAEEILWTIAEKMEKEGLQYQDDINFSRCPEISNNYICDSFDIPFEYGKMGELKKEAKKLFNQVKKELNI